MPDNTTMKNALLDSMPGVIGDDAKAETVVDAFYEVIKNSIEGCENLTLHGVGEFVLDGSGQEKELIFTPDRILLDAVNEGTVGVGAERK